MNPTFGSLFAGVGGFDLGFEAAGYDCKFQVEWDKHCQQVLGYHWPDVPRWGDVSDVNGAEIPPVDVITYGFPCQDLSVAGKRAGLDGDRSTLFFEAIRIITEMREATNGLAPTFAVAENVVGLLNADGGSAMARCLDALAEAGAVAIEWCVLDAQWFGVPQRRRRVFLTACFDPSVAERCPDPLFPVAEGSARNPAEVEQERQSVAALTANGVGTCGADDNQAQAGHLIPFRQLGFGHYTDGDQGSAVKARDYKDATDLVAFTKDRRAQTTDQHAVAQPIGFSHTQGMDCQPSVDNFPTLRSQGGGQAVAQPDLAVRRLTPVECERLMGWPDGHTLHRADGKDNSDSQRYKQCGNGVAAPVAQWIAKHLRTVLEHDETPPAGER